MNRFLRFQRSIVLVVILFPFCLAGQQGGTGNWIMYFGANKISKQLSIHTEVQYRNYTIVPNNIEQLLLRTGLNYHFSKKAFATIGYGHIGSYVYDSPQSKPEVTEHRIWQQFILVNKLSRLKFEHRYRLEQRWVNDIYKNRFRYRLMLFLPINNHKIEPGTFFLGAYDEIFVNSSKSFFDRNRLYGAFGYQLNKATSLQAGVLYQRVSDFGKWYLQIAVIFNPDFRTKTTEKRK